MHTAQYNALSSAKVTLNNWLIDKFYSKNVFIWLPVCTQFSFSKQMKVPLADLPRLNVQTYLEKVSL